MRKSVQTFLTKCSSPTGCAVTHIGSRNVLAYASILTRWIHTFINVWKYHVILVKSQNWMLIKIQYISTSILNKLVICKILPISQSGPVHPGGHLHVNEAMLLMHSPPLAHGLAKHSSRSLKKKFIKYSISILVWQ